MLEIVINNYYEEDISSFVQYVVYELRSYILSNIDSIQVKRADEYINSDYSPYKELSDKGIKLSVRNVIIGAVKLLTYESSGTSEYRIFINPNETIGNTGITYASVIALITNGNLSFSPYKLFSDAMEKFDKDIPNMFEKYIGESI